MVWPLVGVGSLLFSNVSLEETTALEVKSAGIESVPLTTIDERAKRFVLLEPKANDDTKVKEEDDDLQPISLEGNTWYKMMTYMVKHTYPDQKGLMAIVVPPCDSIDSCLEPVARPLGKDELKDILCVYAEQIGKQYIRNSFTNDCATQKYGSIIPLSKATDLKKKPKPIGQVKVSEKPSYCFCYQDGRPPYALRNENVKTVFMGVAECVEYGGHYPGTYTFRELLKSNKALL